MSEPLFVYGTLLPGHLRWGMLLAHAIDQWPAVTPGQLYDTGNGWPAAAFDTGRGAQVADEPVVRGWIVVVDPPDLMGLFAEMDAMEGIATPPDPAVDPYVRLRVATRPLADARERPPTITWGWSYHVTSVEPSWSAISEWTDQEEH